jgi:hypothetical protein
MIASMISTDHRSAGKLSTAGDQNFVAERLEKRPGLAAPAAEAEGELCAFQWRRVKNPVRRRPAVEDEQEVIREVPPHTDVLRGHVEEGFQVLLHLGGGDSRAGAAHHCDQS